MMCYKDMTFCSKWKECIEGEDCHRALTKDIIEKASGTNLQLSVTDSFNCFLPKE
jgi:hypothetical protein